MTKKFICAVSFLIYTTPSIGITLISGTEPIKNGDNYYWWIENRTQHQTMLVTWLSFKNHQDKLSEYEVKSGKNILNNSERTLITVNSKALRPGLEIWLNIMEKNNFSQSIRLTRVRVK